MKLDAHSLAERVAHWAQWSPEATALDDGRVALTYRELDAIARRVAARVAEAGCGRGDLVLVEGAKRAGLVAVLIGVLRAGAAYVPVQPGAPPERFASVLAKTGARLLIADAPESRPLPEGVAALAVETACAPHPRDEGAPVAVEAGDPAYVLFTSGSTGLPNGAVISHGAMTTFFGAVNCWMGVTVRSRCLNTSALYFDVSVCDTMLPLYCGATVHLTPDRLLPQRIVSLIETKAITSMCAVGSTLALVAETPGFAERRWPQMASVMTGAEVLNPAVIRAWLAACPNAHVFNGYGPTEATCVATIHAIHPGNAGADVYPIGQPLPGLAIALADPDGAAAPGDTGELWLRGAQVMDFYVGDPDLTAAKLVAADGERSYRTGDLAALRDGALHFLGRSDDTVKVRGYRIALSDVAHQFRGAPGVLDAVAARMVHERFGEIVALAVEARGGEIGSVSLEALEAASRDRLPAYMRPRLYAVLERFPRKPSGKVDAGLVRTRLAEALARTEAPLTALPADAPAQPEAEPL